MSASKRRFGRSFKPFKRPMLWGGLWMLAISAVVIGSLLPSQDLPSVGVDDKLQHFFGYAVLSACAVQLFARRASWGFVCVLLVLMGIGLEFPVSYTHLDVYKRQSIRTIAPCTITKMGHFG